MWKAPWNQGVLWVAMDQGLEGSIELSPVKTCRRSVVMKCVFFNLPQSVQVREEVWGQLIWLHSYCRVLTVTTYILRTLSTLQISRSAVAMGVSGHQSHLRSEGNKGGNTKESGRRQSSTWTRQPTLSSLTTERFQRPRKTPDHCVNKIK